MMRVFLLVAGFFLSACSAGADISGANTAAHRFHDLQTTGQDDIIYAEADETLRDSTTLETLARINTAVRNAKCETEFPAEATTWRMNATTNGYFVTLDYQRECQALPWVETFMFKKVGETWRAVSYNASGAALFPQNAPAPSTDAPPQTIETAPAAPPPSPDAPPQN